VRSPKALDIVTETDLERELTSVRNAAESSSAGVFGPDSVTWRVDREAAVFLGAGRALLLQLAHPWVAAAIAEHSRTLSDPIGRFHRTFNIVFTMVFGTTGQALTAARALHRRHDGVAGVLTESAGAFPAGSSYKANDVAALCWVYATLTDSALVAYQLVRPPLSNEDRERYYAESRLFAALFGIPQSALPESWSGFADYFAKMIGSDILAIGSAARRIATELFSGAGTGWRIPAWYRALTARQMPVRLLHDFALAYGPLEHRRAERTLAILRYIYPLMPSTLRYVGPYLEARARLAGRTRPNLPTRALNRFWIGRSSMPFADQGADIIVRKSQRRRFALRDLADL
jgi:uncharacterized protein (DUF2236 family)